MRERSSTAKHFGWWQNLELMLILMRIVIGFLFDQVAWIWSTLQLVGRNSILSFPALFSIAETCRMKIYTVGWSLPSHGQSLRCAL